MIHNEQSIFPRIKRGLGITHNDSDDILLQLVRGSYGFLQSSGVAEMQLSSELAVQAMTILVSDVWQNGGKFELSPAINHFLSLLYSESRVEEV